MSEMGRRIRDLRLDAGLTQEQLGDMVGLQKSAIADTIDNVFGKKGAKRAHAKRPEVLSPGLFTCMKISERR